MTAIVCPYGFRVVGPTTEARRLIDWSTAFGAYADCDQRAELAREAYLSAFQFGGGFRKQLEATGSVRGFAGVCWSPWVWFDIDRADDLSLALGDARRLATAAIERFRIGDDDMLAFYSGSKGFHVGIPSALWQPEPSAIFNATARRFALRIAELAGVNIDTAVYDKVRCFRAPNSRHPASSRYKRRLSFDELLHLSVATILGLAASPCPFEIPHPTCRSDKAAADWSKAAEVVQREAEAKAQRRIGNSSSTLNRATLEFIRNGAAVGDRHRLLFSAAANLAEFYCPSPSAYALLTEAALDSGLSPSDVKRQIDCGLRHEEVA